MNFAELLARADRESAAVENDKTEFALITPGEYEMAITKAEGPFESSRTNPSNPAEHGQYIKIECTISGPSFSGRKVWFNNNILVFQKDSSDESVKRAQKAMAMASRERKVMLESLGRTGVERAEELVGATFVGTVVIEKGTNGYKDKNGVSKIRACGSSAAQTAPSSSGSPARHAPASTPTASASRPKMPWEK